LGSKFNGLLFDRLVLKHVIDAGRKYFRPSSQLQTVRWPRRITALTYSFDASAAAAASVGRPAGFDEETTK
jgi:hypothetical protein